MAQTIFATTQVKALAVRLTKQIHTMLTNVYSMTTQTRAKMQ